MKHIISEASRATWQVEATGLPNSKRAYWVMLLEGKSKAMPNVLGFYAASLEDAQDKLTVPYTPWFHNVRA